MGHVAVFLPGEYQAMKASEGWVYLLRSSPATSSGVSVRTLVVLTPLPAFAFLGDMTAILTCDKYTWQG